MMKKEMINRTVKVMTKVGIRYGKVLNYEPALDMYLVQFPDIDSELYLLDNPGWFQSLLVEVDDKIVPFMKQGIFT